MHIMFIHGAWLTPASFELFRASYEARGHTCVAPPWSSDGQVVDGYADEIDKLDGTPVLIGHSFGGLIVQQLLDRGLGAAGVAIAPTALSNRMPAMSFETFSRSFAQTLPDVRKRAAYDRYIVSDPGTPDLRTNVNWNNPDRAPLLLISGSEDRIGTPSMMKQAFDRQRRTGALTERKTFAGRSHFLCIEQGWDEVARYAIEWVGEYAVGDETEPPRMRLRAS